MVRPDSGRSYSGNQDRKKDLANDQTFEVSAPSVASHIVVQVLNCARRRMWTCLPQHFHSRNLAIFRTSSIMHSSVAYTQAWWRSLTQRSRLAKARLVCSRDWRPRPLRSQNSCCGGMRAVLRSSDNLRSPHLSVSVFP